MSISDEECCVFSKESVVQFKVVDQRQSEIVEILDGESCVFSKESVALFWFLWVKRHEMMTVLVGCWPCTMVKKAG